MFPGHNPSTKGARPPSPPQARPSVRPIAGPMRRRQERLKEEERQHALEQQLEERKQLMAAAQAEALAAATAAASSSRSSYDAAGLGFGSTHPGHFSYTRNAPYKGVNIGEPASGTGSSVVATNRVPLKKQSRGDGTLPGSDKAKEPIVCKDPLDYAQTKTRFRDPITLAAPQALGYGKRHPHYSHYMAPIVSLQGQEAQAAAERQQEQDRRQQG